MKNSIINGLLLFLLFVVIIYSFYYFTSNKEETAYPEYEPAPVIETIDTTPSIEPEYTNEIEDEIKESDYKPYSALETGTWNEAEHAYINENLNMKINVPKGWSVSNGSTFIHLSQYKTGNFIDFTIHKYSTPSECLSFEKSQGKPRGINYREREVESSKTIAGDTYLSLTYDILHIKLSDEDEVLKRDPNDVAYSEEHYYKEVVWDYNDWSLGDDTLEIRCRIYEKNDDFNLNKIIEKLH